MYNMKYPESNLIIDINVFMVDISYLGIFEIYLN